MYQLRIYTLRTAEALERYATAHWPGHIPSLRAFGITTHGIWTDHDADAHRLVALISYPDGADPAEVSTAYMASPEFAADMLGFDIGDIVDVDELLQIRPLHHRSPDLASRSHTPQCDRPEPPSIGTLPGAHGTLLALEFLDGCRVQSMHNSRWWCRLRDSPARASGRPCTAWWAVGTRSADWAWVQQFQPFSLPEKRRDGQAREYRGADDSCLAGCHFRSARQRS